MWSHPRRLAFLAGLALLCTACASAAPARSRDGAGSSFSLGRPLWCAAGANECPADPSGYESSSPAASRALRPEAPWLGEIGISHALDGRSAVGCGIAVPGRYLGDASRPELADHARSLGVGVWWKLDF